MADTKTVVGILGNVEQKTGQRGPYLVVTIGGAKYGCFDTALFPAFKVGEERECEYSTNDKGLKNIVGVKAVTSPPEQKSGGRQHDPAERPSIEAQCALKAGVGIADIAKDLTIAFIGTADGVDAGVALFDRMVQIVGQAAVMQADKNYSHLRDKADEFALGIGEPETPAF